MAIFMSLALALPIHADDALQTEEIEITATSIDLNAENPQQKLIGQLKFIKGFKVTSDYEYFGGLSGLSRRGKSEDIIVDYVSDRGLIGHFTLDKDYKTDFKSFRFIVGIPWKATSKKIGDAESIVSLKRSGASHTLIAFEQFHRIMAYHEGSENGTPLPLPPEINTLRSNGGLETMELLRDGRLFLIAEHPTIKSKQHFAWIGSASADDPLNFNYITRLIAPPDGYSPTDATQLPNGDLLVLLRRFTPTDGVSAKFWRINKSMLDSSGTITGEVIATMKPPLNVDNMEGIALIDVSKDGNPVIAVISDDNYSLLQRTLLMIFEIVE